MIDIRPAHQLGYLLPVMVGDTIYYQFHRVFPPDVLLVAYPLGLASFTPAAVDVALGHFWEGVEFLRGRGVERIVQGGIPVSAPAGRERILRLIAEARPSREIAEALVLSPSTVQRHRANIMAKLGLHSRADLIKYAIRRSIVELHS